MRAVFDCACVAAFVWHKKKDGEERAGPQGAEKATDDIIADRFKKRFLAKLKH